LLHCRYGCKHASKQQGKLRMENRNKNVKGKDKITGPHNRKYLILGLTEIMHLSSSQYSSHLKTDYYFGLNWVMNS
jgi:hypothetical protein